MRLLIINHSNSYAFLSVYSQVEIDSGPEDLLLSEFDYQHQNIVPSVESDTPLIQLYTFFLFMFQALFSLSDTALNVLITFFTMFIKTLKHVMLSSQSFLSKLLANLRAARNAVSNGENKFEKFMCCPTCRSIYQWKGCITELPNGSFESKFCNFVLFPNHPQVQHRKPCDTILMKKVKSSNRRLILYPKLIYTYKSIIESLQDQFRIPGFLAV